MLLNLLELLKAFLYILVELLGNLVADGEELVVDLGADRVEARTRLVG